ncbi:glycosyltransferase family 39 protein [Gordonia sp. VNQ95]|jgi:mannosyltransferase|uniref:glycosyltransferase family 39 protein n=1 Tax=Gordonia sp. VNQ95 TaxID=3156619 RepID=UPI0032B49FC1
MTRLRGAGVPLLVGLIGALVAAWGSWRPSLWYDEAATISSVNRTVPQIFHLVDTIDGVHAAYYLFMRAWTLVFGFSEFSVRLPSALAVGVAAGLVVVLGRIVWDNAFGVLCALALLTVPRVMWAGSEARGYAGAMALTVAAMLLLLIALDRGRWWWIAYSVTGIAMVVWFFLSITVIPAQIVMILVLRRRIPRAAVFAMVAVVVAVTPFAWWVFGQRRQIDWLPPMTLDRLETLILFEIPDGSWPYLIGVSVVVVAGVAVAAFRSAAQPWPILIAAASWWLIPTGVIVIYSWLASPTYTPRYLIFAVPGFAIVVAWAVRAMTGDRRVWQAVLVGLLIALMVPSYLAQRGPYGRTGETDFSQVAEYVQTHAHPGDCVAFGPSPGWSPVSMRAVLRGKPDSFVGLRDIGARRGAAVSGSLWDEDRPVERYREFAAGCSVMWVIGDRDRDTAAQTFPGGMQVWTFRRERFVDTALHRELSDSGLHVVQQIPFTNSQVILMERDR